MAFEHGGKYKISSAYDGCVLDLSGNKAKKGAKIIAYDWNGGANQTWKTNAESDGFRIATGIPADKDTDYIPVLDEAVKDSMIVIGSLNGKLNQQWVAKEVPNGEGAYLIQNVNSGKCLYNMGHGKQVNCISESVEDRKTWWNISQI